MMPFFPQTKHWEEAACCKPSRGFLPLFHSVSEALAAVQDERYLLLSASSSVLCFVFQSNTVHNWLICKLHKTVWSFFFLICFPRRAVCLFIKGGRPGIVSLASVPWKHCEFHSSVGSTLCNLFKHNPTSVWLTQIVCDSTWIGYSKEGALLYKLQVRLMPRDLMKEAVQGLVPNVQVVEHLRQA